MERILFTNISIVDGTGAAAFTGEVLVEGNRIKSVARSEKIERTGAVLVDGSGNTLMPGLVDGHMHLTYPFSIDRTPAEPLHVADLHLSSEFSALITAHNAKVVLDAGFTSAYSSGGSTETMEVTIRNEIDGGWIPGPRFRAGGTEGVNVSGVAALNRATEVEEVVNAVRRTKKIGAEVVKFILSGPGGAPHEDNRCMYTDAQLEAAGRTAQECGVWLSGHARFNGAIRQALRFGWRVINHADRLDEETLDMMEARKNEIFICPTIGLLAHLSLRAKSEEQKRLFKRALDMHQPNVERMLKRGIRVLPSGDYGFAEIPHGMQARDLEHFVTYLGLSPVQVIMSATKWGGELMGMPDLGLVKEGFLADLLLVKGDPTKDITLLQNQTNLLMIMKDGRYHKAPVQMRRVGVAA